MEVVLLEVVIIEVRLIEVVLMEGVLMEVVPMEVVLMQVVLMEVALMVGQVGLGGKLWIATLECTCQFDELTGPKRFWVRCSDCFVIITSKLWMCSFTCAKNKEAGSYLALKSQTLKCEYFCRMLIFNNFMKKCKMVIANLKKSEN